MVELGHEVTCYDRSGSDVMTGCAADCRGRVIDGVHASLPHLARCQSRPWMVATVRMPASFASGRGTQGPSAW